MAQQMNRLEGRWLDAALHLLDRQVIDVEGRMVCNVDDVELTESAGGELAVTGLLVGPPALWPRFSGRLGGWLGESWLRLGVQYAERGTPLYLGLDLVTHVGSDVRLRVGREGVLGRQPASGPGVVQRRMDHLLGMDVVRGGERLGHVLDVRLEPRRAESRLLVTGLVVGRGRPGSLLGYDRGDFNGPVLVDWVVSWLHRHTVLAPIESVARVDWDAGTIELSGPVSALRTT
jgi:sporulation protein YlmC with PRC-barrel domain